MKNIINVKNYEEAANMIITITAANNFQPLEITGEFNSFDDNISRDGQNIQFDSLTEAAAYYKMIDQNGNRAAIVKEIFTAGILHEIEITADNEDDDDAIIIIADAENEISRERKRLQAFSLLQDAAPAIKNLFENFGADAQNLINDFIQKAK